MEQLLLFFRKEINKFIVYDIFLKISEHYDIPMEHLQNIVFSNDEYDNNEKKIFMRSKKEKAKTDEKIGSNETVNKNTKQRLQLIERYRQIDLTKKNIKELKQLCEELNVKKKRNKKDILLSLYEILKIPSNSNNDGLLMKCDDNGLSVKFNPKKKNPLLPVFNKGLSASQIVVKEDIVEIIDKKEEEGNKKEEETYNEELDFDLQEEEYDEIELQEEFPF